MLNKVDKKKKNPKNPPLKRIEVLFGRFA
jgi:hypothetical protein